MPFKQKVFLIIGMTLVLGPAYLILPQVCSAGNTMVTPSIQVTGTIDDNVNFDQTEAEDDFVSTYKPSLLINYSTPALSLGFNTTLDFSRHAKEQDNNGDHWQISLNGQYKRERAQLSLGLSYVNDMTFLSELDETGLVTERSDRRRDSQTFGFSYNVSELSSIALNFSHSETKYSWSENVDNDNTGTGLSFSRQLANQRDSITARLNYSSTNSEVSQIDNYGLSLGWSRSLSQVYSLSVSLGGRNTQIENKLAETADREEESRGTTIDISLQKSGDNHSASFGYNRDIGVSSSAEPIERDRISLQGALMLSTRFTLGLSGSLSYTKSESELGEIDSKFYQISPFMSYRITENGSLRIEYSYANSLDFTLSGDQEAERNRLTVSLNFGFPKQF